MSKGKSSSQSMSTSVKRKRIYEYPKWKLVAPKDDESKEKVVDNKTYYWCSKCRDGKGLWSLHSESKAKNASNSNDTPKKDNKKDESPPVTINPDLLKIAKAHLSRYADANFG